MTSPGDPGSPEDLLSGMFKSSGFGKSQNMTKMLYTLIRNVQINMLKQLRSQIDRNIKTLTEEGKIGAFYDADLDPYKILGVEQDATREEINKAYRKKVAVAHPDKGGSNEEFIKVQAAYEAIKQFRGWK